MRLYDWLQKDGRGRWVMPLTACLGVAVMALVRAHCHHDAAKSAAEDEGKAAVYYEKAEETRRVAERVGAELEQLKLGAAESAKKAQDSAREAEEAAQAAERAKVTIETAETVDELADAE